MNYIKPISIAVVVLALVGLFSYLSITKANLASDLASAQRDVEALTIANKNFAAQVDQQNKAIEAANQAALVREREADKAIADAQKQAAQTVSEAQATLAAKPTSKDDCKAAEALMDKYIRSRK